MIGFCTTPSRASAAISTGASSTVGSTHDTTSPGRTPRSWRPAAATSAAAASPAAVSSRPWSSATQHPVGVLLTRTRHQFPEGRRHGERLAHVTGGITPDGTARPTETSQSSARTASTRSPASSRVVSHETASSDTRMRRARTCMAFSALESDDWRSRNARLRTTSAHS